MPYIIMNLNSAWDCCKDFFTTLQQIEIEFASRHITYWDLLWSCFILIELLDAFVIIFNGGKSGEDND